MPLDSDLLLSAEDVSYLSSPLATCSRIVPNFRPRDHQKIISDAIVDAQQGRGPRFIGVSIGQQYGKALALDTPIPTPSGWTTMGDLRVGDEVFDETGLPTKVVAATQVFYDRPCYVVKFDDRETIIADAEHLWKISLDRGKRADVATIHKTTSLAKKRFSRSRINNTAPLNLPELNLPIDPYLLGIWLGDGTSATGDITQGDEDAPEVLGYITEAGYVIRAKQRSRYLVEGLSPHLRVLGLLNNKHVPQMYLRSSENQRWGLLHGLIDSDGYVDPKGLVEFTTTKESLVEGVEELLHSLGIKVMTYKSRATLYGRDIGPKWRLCFYHPNAARLTRKRRYCREPVSRKHRYVFAEETASVPVRCIQVANASGMFLVGRGMVPTHNSTVTSQGTPLWWLELHSLGLVPGGLVGLMSYEDSLAMSWSIKIRRAIEANPDAYFSTLRKDSKAAGYWETEQGGGVIAIGTAGSIQGRPISLLGIDDPTKNFDQAMSLNHQDKLWDLWTSVIFGRLQPWTIVLVTMARWAPYDFMGRLKSTEYEGDPEDWRFINIPVIADEDPDPLGREIGAPLIRPQADQTPDEALEELARVKRSISTYAWNSLWMQNPRDAEGTIFSPTNWRYWGGDLSKDERIELPTDFDQMVFSWDLAFKDLKTSDFVVGGLWGRIDMDHFLIELVRGRWSFTETCTRMSNFVKFWRHRYPKATTVVVEDKANGPAIIDQLRSRVGGLVEFDPSDYGSKLARAHAIQPYQIGGNIYIPSPSERPWVRDYVQEMADFRGDGQGHDDQVDMTTQAINYMQKFNFTPSVVVSPADLDDNLFQSRFTQPRRSGII